VAERQGRVDVPGGQIWFKVVGDGSVPLVTLHGGPGYPSDSLQPLLALASRRQVVFYDQLGCGRSDRPDEVALWTVERFVQELQQLIEALGADSVDLFGHSWGTMLAVDYTLEHPDRVRSLVLASPALSATRWTADCARLIGLLPTELADIYRDPQAGPEDVARLNAEFVRRHFSRLDPWPESMEAARTEFGAEVYQTMWGPNEFTPTGSLADFDRTDVLHRIACPTLFTCGRHDEATPESTAFYASLVPGARVEVFEDSAHVAFHEETERYLEVLGPS
jgi:proline iminopeptidase